MLKVSMIRETELFFDEVLKNDLSLTNFVASDFTMLNGRLAKHYGIPGVDGWEFRKVTLPPDSHRGGVLTMASVLKVTANGTTTSPVAARGVGAGPHPGHAAAAAARQTCRPSSPTFAAPRRSANNWPSTGTIESCASLPSQDRSARLRPGELRRDRRLAGQLPDHRATAKPVIVDGRRMPYLKGKKVDPADVMADGRAVREHRRVQATALEGQGPARPRLDRKLLTYATGGRLRRPTETAVEAIVAKIAREELRLAVAGSRDRAERAVSEQVNRSACELRCRINDPGFLPRETCR